MRGYNKLRKKSFDLLLSELPEKLHYHGIRHTISALDNCEDYIRHYEIDKYQAKLLRIGVLLHDIGFTVSMDDHELEGARIANELMTDLEFSKSDIKVVTELILATKLPQKPKNLLESIICDVDLDYLGRKDFYKISDLLYEELLERFDFFDKNEWNKMQIKFLENHTYHTEFAIKRRQKFKEQRIVELKYKVSFEGRKVV